MSKSIFTKNKIKGFFVFLIVVAIVTVAASAALYFYFGRALAGKDSALNEKLSLGGSFTVKEVVEEQNYKFGWINSDNVNVEVYALKEDGEEVLTETVLEYDKQTKKFSVVGAAKGFIRFSNAIDDSVSYEVPFKTSFSSTDTYVLLDENYPEKFADKIYSKDKLDEVKSLLVSGKSTVDLSDFCLFKNLERIRIKDVPQNKLVDFTSFSLPEKTKIYVEEEKYVDYVSREDSAWLRYAERVFPSVENAENMSVVLIKNGGVFVSDNGDKIESLEVVDGESVNLSEDYVLTKTGYTFDGWYAGDGKTFDDKNKVDDDFKFTADTKLYAKWRANLYSVKVHRNDGSGLYDTTDFVYDEEKRISADTLSYEGFLQIGWAYDENSSSVDFETDELVKNLAIEDGATVDVYAVWVYETFSVQFMSWNADKAYVNYGEAKNYNYGDDIPLFLFAGEPSSSFGSFEGWALSETAPKAEYLYGEKLSSVSIKSYLTSKNSKTLNIYAVFLLETYDLTYDANGGETTPAGAQKVSRGVSVNLSKPISRFGYKFRGWLDNSGHIWTSEALYSADTSWYDSNYAKNSVHVLEENSDGLKAESGIETVRSTAQVVLTAVWKVNSFNVVFVRNGGKCYNDARVTFGRDFTFSGEMSRTGYALSSCLFRFAKNLFPTYPDVELSTGKRTLTSDEIQLIYQMLKNTTADNDFNENLTAYFDASWSAKKYTVTFDYNGGNEGTKTKTVTYDSQYGTLPTPADWGKKGKNGYWTYTFKNWVQKETGKVITKDSIVNIAAAHKLTAEYDSKWHEDSCLADGTLVTMADGTKKAIENVSVGDIVRVWDFEKGAFSQSIVAVIEHDEAEKQIVVDLNFADGTTISVITAHGFFDVANKKFVYITPENAKSFVGRKFLKEVETNGVLSYEAVALTSVKTEERTVGTHSLVTANSLSHFANGYLSIAAGIDGLFNIFEISDELKYDEAAFNADIEAYGLYSYEDFSAYVTYEEYLAFNGAYLKVSVGKGYTTFEEIIAMINRYLK